jgi:hypothetical protein
MLRAEDLSGKRFGRLTIISRAPDKICKGNRKRIMWVCKCDCGNITIKNGDNIRKGNTSSCGCIKEKHSMSYSRLYRIWHGMLERCNNKNHVYFDDYGGRGIDVCDDWKSDFRKFMDWSLSNGYSEKLTIDRIDNNKGYSPDNCKWSTMKEQRNNTRANRNLTYNGITMNVTQWAEMLGISRNTLFSRLRKGWNVEKALSTPVKTNNTLEE